MIGTIRRELLDHVIVPNEGHLRRLRRYFRYYHLWCCHRSLSMDCPDPRAVQRPEEGDVVEVEEAGGLYRH